MDGYQREGETKAQRLDRNWDELLQELRVTQTGVQILTGFLLTLPIQPAFRDITHFERSAYVVAISASILATCLLITPVAVHRWLFRQQRKETLVSIAHHVSVIGLATLAAAVVSVMALTFALVLGQRAGVVAALVGAVLFVAAWVVFPLGLRHRLTRPKGP
ncbi:DUF6328 family protein [Phycicoccus sp. Root101]|uniref:DUF6328 family protein n=1 Tax=Phycicoccus sp. Root101 TaxID=1736421 RepID=UPI0007035C1A|nr:DUF6328 family protein [Phycicoccus sp. Root101]KQU65195.1 hypothetical protein ASC58_16910 [Phycicoccus sp. Root101]